MAIGPREVMRSEVEGGLSGPANPIPSESLDCGCKQLPCPKLAKFATRRLFVGLICWIGIVQAAAEAYLYITSPTLARRFKFDPRLMDWILVIAGLTPAILAVPVAYWGDRIHRVAWTGCLVLLQSAGFVILVIPHFTHNASTIDEPENVTHMSIYAEDNPELCSPQYSRIIADDEEPCYMMLVLVIGTQTLIGMANVAYYALGISYLDDNTKKRHVPALIGVIVAVKVMGLLLGYMIAWGCLEIDADTLTIIESHREIGAWWLGWPILAFLLAIPGLFVSWLPRRLPSEVVEQAAASILDLAGRASPTSFEVTETTKVGGIGYFTSLARLFTNKILACAVLTAVFCTTALINFVASENIILESRYHVPRPTGMLIGFGDPLPSRLIVNMLKPIIIGMVIIISGMVIARTRPRARTLTIYNVVALVLAATIIFSLVFATCDKPPIAEERRGSLDLLLLCNKDCHCSKDADFRPVCDSKSTLTFYSPCHAGCKIVEIEGNVKVYGGCSCVAEMTGSENFKAKEGPCGSSTCQTGWFIFEIGTLLAYSFAASSIVGSVLIVLRAVYVQDKALAIGLWLAMVSLVVYVPGKLVYQTIADTNCKHWGRGSTCHLHDTDSLGNYLCYLTALLLIVAAACQAVLWFFSEKMMIYGNPQSELPRATELQDFPRAQAVPLLDENSAPSNVGQDETVTDVNRVVIIESSSLDLREQKVTDDAHQQSTEPLKYGPLGPGDRRITSVNVTQSQEIVSVTRKMRNAATDDELDSSSDDDGAPTRNGKKKITGSSPKIAYRPLELDSDVESDLSSIGPRSRRRVPSGVFDDPPKDYGSLVSPSNKRPFPNPDHYEDPRGSKKPSILDRADRRNGKSLENLVKTRGGFSRTNSFEFKKDSKNNSLKSHEGDFNEVGIPVMEPVMMAGGGSAGPEVPQQEVQVLLPRHQKHVSQERLDTIRSLLDSVDENRRHRLENETLTEDDGEEYPEVPPPIVGRPPSRGQVSSGFGSLLDVREKNYSIASFPGSGVGNTDSRKVTEATRSTPTNPPGDGKNKGGPLSTAL